MGKRLTIILGAGASRDLIAIKTAQVNEDYLPPLTSELFGPPMETTGQRRETFQGILEGYPGAKSLASQISIRVSGGEPLEEILRS